ncbi:MAG TPA: SgcJ/EcaC family oxidoreductase [Blastocatellia bacterium]|jgi:uncharacterized protein (TIGR02246 family)|nr:SgcJ/EcaC family oxidoreductase [Blastocatellia bacterium]
MTQFMILSAAIISLALAPLCAATTNVLTSDEDAIRKWISDYTVAWNKHDARSLALLFREDADFVGGSGGIFRGRSQIERLMAEEFSAPLKEWKLTNAIEDIRFLKPDIAIVNGTYEATGIGSNAQSVPLKGLYTVIMGKERGQWVGLGARSIVR